MSKTVKGFALLGFICFLLWLVFGGNCHKPTPLQPSAPIVRLVDDTMAQHRGDSFARESRMKDAQLALLRTDNAAMLGQLLARRVIINQLLNARKVYVRTGDSVAVQRNSDTLASAVSDYLPMDEQHDLLAATIDTASIAQAAIKDSIIANQRIELMAAQSAAHQLAAIVDQQGKTIAALNKRLWWQRLGIRILAIIALLTGAVAAIK